MYFYVNRFTIEILCFTNCIPVYILIFPFDFARVIPSRNAQSRWVAERCGAARWPEPVCSTSWHPVALTTVLLARTWFMFFFFFFFFPLSSILFPDMLQTCMYDKTDRVKIVDRCNVYGWKIRIETSFKSKIGAIVRV